MRVVGSVGGGDPILVRFTVLVTVSLSQSLCCLRMSLLTWHNNTTLSNVIRYFVNVLPLRVSSVSLTDPVSDAIAKTRDVWLSAIKHADVSFHHIVEEICTRARRPNVPPIFQTLFEFALGGSDVPSSSTSSSVRFQRDLRPPEYSNTIHAKFDMSVRGSPSLFAMSTQ